MSRNQKTRTFYAQSRSAWRKWLEEHGEQEEYVWLIIYKKASQTPSITYPEAVDEALCFGWIDSKANKRDARSYYQYFAKRNPRSNWSRVNKQKVAKLEAAGLLAPPGIRMIRLAKETGTWNALDDVENLVIPADLGDALDRHPDARRHFEAFPRSAKRGILEWIFNAKRPETRARRIEKTARLASRNIRANA